MKTPKCPTGRGLGAHEQGLCECSEESGQSSLVSGMHLRYAKTNTVFRHRNDRRLKDARRSWKNEEH